MCFIIVDKLVDEVDNYCVSPGLFIAYLIDIQKPCSFRCQVVPKLLEKSLAPMPTAAWSLFSTLPGPT